jgi:RNA polymerase-associated protein RTF1
MEGRPQSFYTDMHVKLSSGKSTKEWPFTHCSESPFTEAEFSRWKKQLEVDNLPLPSKSECRKHCDAINALIDHRFTGEELNQKLAKQNKYRHLLQPVKPSLVKNSSMDQQQKLQLRNQLNRKQNTEDVRKALVAEKNKQRAAARARAKAAQEKAAQDAAASLTVPKSDMDGLFSDAGSDISRTATPVPGPNRLVQEKKGGIPTFSKVSMEDDILGSIDLGIDIDI